MIKKLCNKIDSCRNQENIVFIFLAVWLVINLVQSFFTELHPDEAYYWMYSQKLDWGYFDHPPIIALLIKAGFGLFHNELGVRFFLAIMGTGTIFVIYNLAKGYLPTVSVFILLISSMVIVQSHIGGFLAIPDIPIVFFSSLFFLVYKNYIKKDSISTAVLLALIIGGMFYSKYHALLVVVFTLFANLQILKRSTFWLIPVLFAIIMLPHLFWQIDNNFPTFEYHLVSRSSPYKIDFTINYILSQLLIAGPFIGPLVFYQSFKVTTKESLFLKVMKVNFWGFILFFLAMSFKGRVEAHWTAIAYIPGLVLTFYGIGKAGRGIYWAQVLFVPTLLVFLTIRILLVFPAPIKNTAPGRDFYNYKVWANEIKSYAEGRKVVFVNSFQKPSKYSFYTNGEFTSVLNSIHYRKNQYDIWNGVNSLQGQNILLVGAYRYYDTIKTVKGPYRVRKIDNFQSYYDVIINPKQDYITAQAGHKVSLGIDIENIRKDSLKFISSDPKMPVRLNVIFNAKKGLCNNQLLDTLLVPIPPGDSQFMETSFFVPEEKGEYDCYISIVNDGLLPSFNSRPLSISVK